MSPADETLWRGARNVGAQSIGRSGGSSPSRLRTWATSVASHRSSGGRITGRKRANVKRGDQHPVDMAHRPIEGELTEERGARRRRLVRARQGDRDGDRKVETRALLAQLGRREIDGETRVGEFQAAVADRGADAFACLLHGRRGQADQGELAVAATGDVCLDVDAAHVKAGEYA